MESNGNSIDPEMPALVREKPTNQVNNNSHYSETAGGAQDNKLEGIIADSDTNGIPHHISKDDSGDVPALLQQGEGEETQMVVVEEPPAPELEVETVISLDDEGPVNESNKEEEYEEEDEEEDEDDNNPPQLLPDASSGGDSNNPPKKEAALPADPPTTSQRPPSAPATDNNNTQTPTNPASTTKSTSPDSAPIHDNNQENSVSEDPPVNESMDSSAMAAEESSTNTETPAGRKERKKKKTRSELDRLLMDEGTVKILMGSPRGSRGTPRELSREEKMKQLSKVREEAINQVRESSKTKLFNKVSLRLKSKNRRQQQQQEQREAKKAKLSEPASKIIRRRSSSSNFNFSSRSPSPVHPNAPLQSSPEDIVQVRIQDSVGYITVEAEAVTFNTKVASRLTAILNSLKQNDQVTAVQLTTTSDFIQGLDIDEIRTETDDSLRESMADSMIACLDALLKTLINYPKLLVAGVNGDAVDFGVLILSYFDMVYASDKATFQTNYGKNGYLPECLQLFPKNRLTHVMLYTGRKLTATEGLSSGLVTEVLLSAKFQDELATRIKTITSANPEVLLRTKGEVNTKNSSKLELSKDLRSSWLRF